MNNQQLRLWMCKIINQRIIKFNDYSDKRYIIF
nr:MAG TPA: hypothetical protein [Caudoviricetes sp.]